MLRRAPSVGSSGYQRWWGGEAGACTESLGSESGDVGCDAAEIDHFFPPPTPAAAPAGAGAPADADDEAAALCGAEEEEEDRLEAAAPEKRRRGGGFPPPMPRATGALFLRAERRDGRLILTEVRAHERGRRVVFRAERDGGRLRLRFANDDDDVPDGGEPGAGGGGHGGAAAGGAGGVVAVAVQHGAGAGGAGGGELCQVAAGRRGVEVGAVMMGTTI